jgi:hypothetical protein
VTRRRYEKAISATVLIAGLATSIAKLKLRIRRQAESRLILRDETLLAQSPKGTGTETSFVVMFLTSTFCTVDHMRLKTRPAHSVSKGRRKSTRRRLPAISANSSHQHGSRWSSAPRTSAGLANVEANHHQGVDRRIVLADEVAS